MRIQKGSPTIHVCKVILSFVVKPETWLSFHVSLQAEISALENAGRLPASAYKGATMFTTLSPCE